MVAGSLSGWKLPLASLMKRSPQYIEGDLPQSFKSIDFLLVLLAWRHSDFLVIQLATAVPYSQGLTFSH